jgi:hypothetical protein
MSVPGAVGAGPVLEGDLSLPPAPAGVVAFAHGSGSSRHSPATRRSPPSCNPRAWRPCSWTLLTAEQEPSRGANDRTLALLDPRHPRGAAAYLQLGANLEDGAIAQAVDCANVAPHFTAWH